MSRSENQEMRELEEVIDRLCLLYRLSFKEPAERVAINEQIGDYIAPGFRRLGAG